MKTKRDSEARRQLIRKFRIPIRSKTMIRHLKNLRFPIFLILSFYYYPFLAYNLSSSNGLTLIADKPFEVRREPPYVDFNGRVIKAIHSRNETKKLERAHIVVLNQNKEVITETYTNKRGLFRMKLPLNKYYTIKISKKGWANKTILIDTRVDKPKKRSYFYPIDIYVFEDIPSVDASILREPIAVISFNQDINRFDHDRQYTNNVNESLKELYAAYYSNHAKHKNYRTGKLQTIRTKLPETNLAEKKVTKTVTEPPISSVNKNEVKNEKQTTAIDQKNPEIIFRIQILSSPGQVPLCAKIFQQCGKVREHIHNDEYKYTVGEFRTLEAALKDLQELTRKGYKDAFTIGFVNGKRTTASEAHKILQTNQHNSSK